HLVFATSELAWKTTVTNYLGGAGARTAEQPIVPEDALKRLAVQDREALLFVDLAAVREIVLAFGGGSPDGKELRRVLEVSGAGGLTAFGCAVGFRDGGLEGAVHLGLRAGAGGILEAIRSGLPPLGKDAAGALALIPAAAHDVQAATVAPGKLLREIDAALRRGVPEIAGDMDDFYRMVEANVAVSVEQDLFGLGEITFVAFGIDPPAGGLFGDQVVLARTEAVEPYWKVLEKAAEALGAPIEPIEAAGGKVLTCNLAGGKAAEAFRGAIFEGRGFVPSGPEMLILLAAGTGAYVTRADLPGGWTALSALPQAAVRHLESYSKGPRLPADGELASLLKAQLGGASVVGANQGDRTFLYLYNTAVSLLGAFGPLLAVVGVNPAHLPPAERFLADARAGFLRLEAGPEGFTLRGHRWHGSPAVALAAVGAGAMMAGFLVPTLARGRGEALAVQCMNNLKQLYTFSLAYSEDAGGDAFPYSPEGSVAALRLLIEHDEDHQLPAKLFVCPEGGHEAPAVEEGKVALTEETSSYEVVPWRLRSTTANAIFMYDKGPHHRGRRNVLFSDGSIQVLEEGEFQERLAREKEASAKKAAPGKKAPAKKKKARKAPPKEDPEEDE
ncbi:MAG: hypothetical protein HY721_26955, partial [Planctomycetes bacterium]|nr:hypothetical protein [Planctomycetota bacterium]